MGISVTRTAAPSTTTSRPWAHVFVPVVSATFALASRLRAFCSSSPVVKCIAPSNQTPISGVTCGRPSVRTVVIQYSSARSSARVVSSQLVAVAFGSLNRLSSLASVIDL